MWLQISSLLCWCLCAGPGEGLRKLGLVTPVCFGQVLVLSGAATLCRSRLEVGIACAEISSTGWAQPATREFSQESFPKDSFKSSFTVSSASVRAQMVWGKVKSISAPITQSRVCKSHIVTSKKEHTDENLCTSSCSSICSLPVSYKAVWGMVVFLLLFLNYGFLVATAAFFAL